METAITLTSHRSHDYRFLIQRWRAVAERCGARLQKWTSARRFPLFHLRTPALQKQGGLYVSAGIHGDEPAGSEALIAWAEGLGEGLRDIPVFILPCLNPWGLVHNRRLDEAGLDLNRVFEREDLPFVVAWRRLMGDHQFSAALTLHEDYDGQGLYLYEVHREPPHWGEALIEAARPFIPIEPRVTVDGRKSKAGLIRRRLNFRWFNQVGYPEAVWLHMHHSVRTFTIETPSEFALSQRVAAHRAVLNTCVDRLKHTIEG